MTRLTGIVAASHPGPALVVTIVTAGLGVAAGLPAPRLALLAVAILLGQVSIGWSNDWIDGRAGRDRGREDKPVAAGDVRLETVRAAALAAAAGTVVTSLLLGWVPGLLHLLAVASGWAYNAGLKSTPLSVAPYLLSFGLLPVIVAAAAGGGGAPWWALLTAACFGAGVHLANALPDLEVDARTGVQGLPQRLGPHRSVVGTVVLLGTGAATVLAGPAGARVDAVTLGTGVVVVLLLIAVVLLARRGRADHAFSASMLTGLVVVAMLVVRGDALA